VLISKSIEQKIKTRKKGSLLFLADFTDSFSYEAVKKVLQRLEKNKSIIRLSRGIYYKPKTDKILGSVYPSVEKIAESIAKRDKARIIPSGSYALYKLGLSEQVPMNIVYLTDGSARVIKVGTRKITFKKTSPKNLAVEHKLSSMLIQGLKALGVKNINKSVKEKIKNTIEKSKDLEEIKMSLHDAPVWVQNIVKKIIIEIENE